MKNSEDKKPKFGPCSEKQKMVLQDNTTDILIIGGGAGGGKSHCGLTKTLKYIKDPSAIVLICRQTFPQLDGGGGLIAESHKFYKPFGGLYNQQKHFWKFPNGAIVKFQIYGSDADQENWQGVQATHVIVDEAAEWTEAQILMVQSRIRSTTYRGGKLQLILTCNPKRSSFLYNWVKDLLDPDTGIPMPGTENIIRWCVKHRGEMVFGESPEELYEKYGAGLTLWEDFVPKTIRFIPMTVDDNPVLLKYNPEYKANLLAMNEADKRRYLYGSWTAVASNEGQFKRDWVNMVQHPPRHVTGRVRAWDLAATDEPLEKSSNPDYTAGVKVSRDKFGRYTIEDVVRFRKRPDEVLKRIVAIGHDDGTEDCQTIIPKDPGSAGKIANQYMIRELTEKGLSVRSSPVNGHTSKANAFLPFCALAQSGNVDVVIADWNEDFFSELENFIAGNRNQKDDQVDATSLSVNTLLKGLDIPAFSIPDCSRPSIKDRLR